MAPILQIKDLRKTYDGGFEALNGVTLDIEEGEISDEDLPLPCLVEESDTDGAALEGPSSDSEELVSRIFEEEFCFFRLRFRFKRSSSSLSASGLRRHSAWHAAA